MELRDILKGLQKQWAEPIVQEDFDPWMKVFQKILNPDDAQMKQINEWKLQQKQPPVNDGTPQTLETIMRNSPRYGGMMREGDKEPGAMLDRRFYPAALSDQFSGAELDAMIREAARQRAARMEQIRRRGM